MIETTQMALGALLAIAARGGPYLIDGRVARSGVTAVSAETGVDKSAFCLSAAAIEAKNLGFRADLGDAPERGERPPILLWVASAEELAVEDGAGEGGSE